MASSEIIQSKGEVQMMKRKWWQLYKRGWQKHIDFWGRRWWIRFKWDVNNVILDDVSKSTCKNCGKTKDRHSEASRMCPNGFNFFEVDC